MPSSLTILSQTPYNIGTSCAVYLNHTESHDITQHHLNILISFHYCVIELLILS